MKFIQITLLALLNLPLCALAQEDKPSVFVRYIAIGKAAPFQYKFQDGVRVQAPPPPGSEPPTQLWIPSLKGENKSFRLSLSGVQSYRELDPNIGDASMYLGADLKDPWVKMRMPTSKLTTALFLRRTQRGAKWDKPGVKVLKDDLRTFPLGHIRVVNLSPRKAFIKIGDKSPVEVSKGATKILKVEQEDKVVLKYLNKAGRPSQLYSNLLELGQRDRMHAYLYVDDSRRSRGQVLLRRFKEHFRMPRPARRTRRTTATTGAGN